MSEYKKRLKDKKVTAFDKYVFKEIPTSRKECIEMLENCIHELKQETASDYFISSRMRMIIDHINFFKIIGE